MKYLSKKLDKDLSMVFFNSVEEMNKRYSVDAELPRDLHSNTDLVCYEIVEPFVFDYLGQYVFTRNGFHHLDNFGSPFINNYNEITLESEVYEDDTFEHEGRCFIYVRVNDYLLKHLEKSLLGCEFVSPKDTSNTLGRRFVHSVVVGTLGAVITDQDGLTWDLYEQLLHLDDYSDPIPYQEWIKQINKQDVEVED